MHFLFAVMMSVLHVISAIRRTLFPPSAGDEYKNHPSRHGSIALPVPEVPKMSVGAICFTSSGSNGGCWVVLVFPRLFFGKMGFFLPIRDLRQKKKFTRLTQKKINFRRKKSAAYAKKKVTRLTPKKKYKSDLRLFPQSSYAFLPRYAPHLETTSLHNNNVRCLHTLPPPLRMHGLV